MEIEKKELDLKLEKGHAVCFDFDGVIHKYSKGWQDGSIYDEYNKNILDLMLLLQKIEIPIYICSTRKPEQIINWWNQQGFWAETIKISDDITFWNDLKFIGVTNRKLPAQLYIDDRAYKYTGQTVKQFILENSIEIEENKMEEYDEIEEAKNWLAALEVNSEFEASSKEYILSHIENQDKMIDEMAKVICMLDTMNNYDTWNNDISEVKQHFESKINNS